MAVKASWLRYQNVILFFRSMFDVICLMLSDSSSSSPAITFDCVICSQIKAVLPWSRPITVTIGPNMVFLAYPLHFP